MQFLRGFNPSYAPFVVLVLFCGGVAFHTYSPDDSTTPLKAPAPSSLLDRPDFSAITDVTEKKATFFDYLLPMVRSANQNILADRGMIERLRGKMAAAGALSSADLAALQALFNKYRITIEGEPDLADVDQLLLRSDVIPASLVLAQSANESAWGTSRFATRANNFFGLWCFSEGCGLTPLRRNDGANHEVARFQSVNAGLVYYMRTINTNIAYGELRNIRAELRAQGRNITGAALAEGLLRYSERGEAYVEEIQQMIRFNGLQRYTLSSQDKTP